LTTKPPLYSQRVELSLYRSLIATRPPTFSGTLQLAITTKGFRRRRKNNVRNGGQKISRKLLIKLQIRKDEKREKEKNW
jgi:hypothetical protein